MQTGASIYYTTDGSSPTESSSLYTGTMTLTSGTTINAKAFKSGYNPSAVAAASFTNSQIAKGATYWASPKGGGSCTSARSTSDPGSGYVTMNDGIKCLSSGDTLILKAGVYTSPHDTNPPSGTPSAYTTIKGEPGQKPILRYPPSDGGQIFLFPDNNWHHIAIENLDLDAVNINGPVIKITCSYSGCPSEAGAHHIRLRDLIIHHGNIDFKNVTVGTLTMGVLGGGPGLEMYSNNIHHNMYGLYWGGNTAVIDGNYIHDNAAYGFHFYEGGGKATSVFNNIVRSNLVELNGTDSAYCSSALLFSSGADNIAYNNIIRYHRPGTCGSSPGGGGIALVINAVRPKIFNNTIYGNNTTGIYIGKGIPGSASGATDAVIRNNISLFNGRCANCGGNYQNLGSGTTADHNIFDDAVNPLFVNPSERGVNNGAGFRLSSGSSPAVNAGADLSSIFTTDYAGVRRPQGSGWDIGAYER